MIIIEAPIAIRGIQTAERDVLRASFRAEVADRRRAISAQFEALLSAAEQQIIAHVQGKIALINPALSPAARRAAIEQLVAEQTAAITQLKHDIKQQRCHARRAAGVALRGKFKRGRSTLVQHHAVERAVTTDHFGAHHHHSKRAPRAFPAIRRMVPYLKQRPALRAHIMRPR